MGGGGFILPYPLLYTNMKDNDGNDLKVGDEVVFGYTFYKTYELRSGTVYRFSPLKIGIEEADGTTHLKIPEHVMKRVLTGPRQLTTLRA